MMDTIVTRFAPSPTGYLHIGGIRTALINYILVNQSKKTNSDSKFILRIEDTDKKRSKKEYVNSIVEGLKWLGIEWDDQIYYQSKRISRHQEVALKLLETKNAYKCVCTQETINKLRIEKLKKNLNIKHLCENCESNQDIQNLKENYCIRIKIPKNGNIFINDIVQGNISVKNYEIDNYVILRNDNSPTYMLSVVVDDYDMQVNTIVRGDDHLNNSFRQYYLYEYLGWKHPKYAHLPLIHGLDGSKLSKRHGAININEFKKIGYLPKAIINYLILLGWSPKKNNEIIEFNEIIDKFNIKDISKSSSRFDYTKLNFLNNFYLQQEDNFKDFELFIKHNDSIKLYLNTNIEKIKDIYSAHKRKIKVFNELVEIIKIYFDKEFVTQPNVVLDDNFNKILSKFFIQLKTINNWNENNIEICIKNFIKKENLKLSFFGKPLRHLLTNNKDGISLGLVMMILGKDLTILRINNYLNNL